MTDVARMAELDRASLVHPFTSIADHLQTEPRVIVQGSGTRVVDDRGREYLDAMAGLWCVNVGHGRVEIADAIAAQARKLAFFHSFASTSNEPSIQLADRLLEIAPEGIGKVFFGTSGSDANDTQVKLVWYYNNLRGRARKKKIIARRGAYHGVTLGAASMTGLPAVHRSFDLPLPGFLHVTTPDPYRGPGEGVSEEQYARSLARELDETIEREGPDTVAAFIAEPVMGAGGVIVPPHGYFEAVQQVLERHDVLFIADEVICGFGRLGTMFGCETFSIRPDLMTIAKGLTSGAVPMSACLISEEIWDVLREGSPQAGPFAHGYTYSGHPLAAAAGLASLDVIQGEKLVDNAARVGALLQSELHARLADHPLVGNVRGVGLIAAVELVRDRARKTPFDAEQAIGRRLSDQLAELGLLCRPLGNAIALSPPLVLREAEVDEICTLIEQGLERVAGDL